MNQQLEYLLNNNWISDQDNNDEKMMAVKIYQNDLEYVLKHYDRTLKTDIRVRYFKIACLFSNNSKILQFIKNTESGLSLSFPWTNSWKCVNTSNKKILLLACKFNNNLEIIQFIVKNLKVDVNYIEPTSGNNCLIVACKHNTNINIIKYLVEDVFINFNHKNFALHNCLIVALMHNTNLEIIKYLIEHGVHRPIRNYDLNFFSCLTHACTYNTNLEIIKYLIKMDDISICDFDFNRALNNNKNIMIAKYLIENTHCQFIGTHDINSLKNLFSIIDFTKLDYTRINKLLLEVKVYDSRSSWIKEIIIKNNSLLLNLRTREFYKIDDPYTAKFCVFAKLVDSLHCQIPYDKNLTNYCPNLYIDCTKKPELLFNHNSIGYYGDRSIVHNSILFLENLVCQLNFDQPIELDSGINLRPRIINLYVLSCYSTGGFPMFELEQDDILPFLKFIDRYPTKNLSIGQLEQDIIDTLVRHNCMDNYVVIGSEINQYLSDICHRYDCKLLYLLINDKLLNTTIETKD